MGKRPRIGQRALLGSRRSPELRAALGPIRRHIRELAKDRDLARREVAELRRIVAEQSEYLNELATRVELLASREDDLRAMLLGAHEQLMRRVDEIRTALSAEVHKAALQANTPEQNIPTAHPSVLAPDQSFLPSEYSSYQQLSKHVYYQRLIGRVREVARATLPPKATVAVVSKGDEELLELGDDRRGWHFPQNEEGVYAGYHPADGAEAIAHLEELRAKGAEFLLLPETSFWWLERYGEFGQHLDSSYRRVQDDEACIIFELSEP